MLRFFLSAVALAGILAMQHPAMADPVAATTSIHTEAAAGGQGQPAPGAQPEASASDARTPGNAGLGKDAVTVGFGWG